MVAVEEVDGDAAAADAPADDREEASTVGMPGPVPEVAELHDPIGAYAVRFRRDDGYPPLRVRVRVADEEEPRHPSIKADERAAANVVSRGARRPRPGLPSAVSRGSPRWSRPRP